MAPVFLGLAFLTSFTVLCFTGWLPMAALPCHCRLAVPPWAIARLCSEGWQLDQCSHARELQVLTTPDSAAGLLAWAPLFSSCRRIHTSPSAPHLGALW